jgi:hypothetical protein
MASTRRASLATAVRVIDRVHSHASHGWTNTSPPAGASFSELSQIVLTVTDLTDRRATIRMHFAHFSGSHSQGRVCAFSGYDLRTSAGGPNHLRTFAGFQFNAMHLRTHWNIPQWQRVARLDRRFATRHHGIAGTNPLRRQYVTTLTVCVQNESHMRATIRIVFNSFDLPWNAILIPLEVDNPVSSFVPTATMTGGYPTLVVAPATARLLVQQWPMRRTFMQPRSIDLDRKTAPGRGRFKLL